MGFKIASSGSIKTRNLGAPASLRVAHLQNEVGAKYSFLSYEISYERCSEFLFEFLGLYFVGLSRQISQQKKQRKFTDKLLQGAQGQAILVQVWEVLWHPKGYQNQWMSKWQVLVTFKTRNFGAPAILEHLWVFPRCPGGGVWGWSQVGGGVWGRVQVGGRGWVSCRKRGKRGMGSLRKRLSKPPCSKLPFFLPESL